MMLSAVVLTKNSELTLENTLKSLTFCDEIVIIDDYSKDKTLQIASKYKTKVYQHQLKDNFANQRNFGLSKAIYEWVFFLDSDEVVPQNLAKEITKRLKGDVQENGFYVKRYDVLWGKVLKHGEIGSLRLLRLGKKATGEWKGSVHEVWELKGNTSELTTALLHYPHQTISEFLKEINAYTSIRAAELYKYRVKVSVWEIIFYPSGKFMLNYIVRLGFLDGVQGLIFALTMSFHSFLVRSKLWQLYDQKQK